MSVNGRGKKWLRVCCIVEVHGFVTVLAVRFTSANQDFDPILVMSHITIFLQFGFTSILEFPGLC